MPNIDFNGAQKIIFDGAYTGLNKNFILLSIHTGPNSIVYALLPEDAKNLAKVLMNTCALYERQYGPIPDSTKPVPSPIDLSKGFPSDHGDQLPD